MLKYITYCLLIFSIFFNSCKDMPDMYPCDKDKDPDCDGYIDPNARLASFPSQGEVIDTNTITLSWSGNQSSSVFSYKLSASSDWSEWSNTLSITYDCITDGSYSFYVKEAYPNGDEQVDATSIYFTIDYINGSAIVLEDQCITTQENNNFEIYISLEEIENVLGAYISISFNPNQVKLTEREALVSLIGSSLTDIIFIATSVIEANANGVLEINMARFSDTPSTSNATQIVKLNFNASTTGKTMILIDRDSELRDSDNNVIEIDKLVNATIDIYK